MPDGVMVGTGAMPDGWSFRPYGALVEEEEVACGRRVIQEALVAGNGHPLNLWGFGSPITPSAK